MESQPRRFVKFIFIDVNNLFYFNDDFTFLVYNI